MPWLTCKSGKIHYELTGPEDGPVCVLMAMTFMDDHLGVPWLQLTLVTLVHQLED